MTRPRRPSSSSTHRYPRSARLNELLREVLAEELNLIDDERLLWVSITQVDVDSEMNHGTVYFDSMRGPEGDASDELQERRRPNAVGIPGAVAAAAAGKHADSAICNGADAVVAIVRDVKDGAVGGDA